MKNKIDNQNKPWYSISCREGKKKNPKELRYAEVSELADEQD